MFGSNSGQERPYERALRLLREQATPRNLPQSSSVASSPAPAITSVTSSPAPATTSVTSSPAPATSSEDFSSELHLETFEPWPASMDSNLSMFETTSTLSQASSSSKRTFLSDLSAALEKNDLYQFTVALSQYTYQSKDNLLSLLQTLERHVSALVAKEDYSNLIDEFLLVLFSKINLMHTDEQGNNLLHMLVTLQNESQSIIPSLVLSKHSSPEQIKIWVNTANASGNLPLSLLKNNFKLQAFWKNLDYDHANDFPRRLEEKFQDFLAEFYRSLNGAIDKNPTLENLLAYFAHYYSTIDGNTWTKLKSITGRLLNVHLNKATFDYHHKKSIGLNDEELAKAIIGGFDIFNADFVKEIFRCQPPCINLLLFYTTSLSDKDGNSFLHRYVTLLDDETTLSTKYVDADRFHQAITAMNTAGKTPFEIISTQVRTKHLILRHHWEQNDLMMTDSTKQICMHATQSGIDLDNIKSYLQNLINFFGSKHAFAEYINTTNQDITRKKFLSQQLATKLNLQPALAAWLVTTIIEYYKIAVNASYSAVGSTPLRSPTTTAPAAAMYTTSGTTTTTADHGNRGEKRPREATTGLRGRGRGSRGKR